MAKCEKGWRARLGEDEQGADAATSGVRRLEREMGPKIPFLSLQPWLWEKGE